jgi:hypothetical protein
MRASLALLVLSLAAACASSSPSSGLNVPLALGAAAASYADGGCAAVCTNGTRCNPRTQACELPCDGACGPSETCSPDDVCVPVIVTTATVAPRR